MREGGGESQGQSINLSRGDQDSGIVWLWQYLTLTNEVKVINIVIVF